MLSDDELIEELRHRFDVNRKALLDLNVVNGKLVMMNEKLERSEALKSDFLSNIRNEINNPLGSIMGLSQQISRSSGLDSVVDMAGVIYSEALNLDFQMRNIFIAAELEAGECAPQIAQVDVISIIRNSIDSFAHLALASEISLKFRAEIADSEGDEAIFPTDAEKVEVIVANLLANAIEFSREGGDIEVRLSLRDRELRLSVADCGIGIAETDKEIIFERFRQLDSGPRRTHRGHGLGLSITKALVDLLGGAIAVSAANGEGALFSVTLPQPIFQDAMEVLAEDGNLFIFSGTERK